MKRIIFYIAIASLLVCSCTRTEARITTAEQAAEKLGCITTDADIARADSILAILYNCKEESLPELMVRAAEALKGTPYVAGTMDNDWHGEKLRIYLTKTDCILFVETCLNLARTAKEATSPDEADFENFAANIAKTRYRPQAQPYTYSDRIHYTTEWIRRQEKEGELDDLTLTLGGKTWDHPISYMSTHSDKYPILSDRSINPDGEADVERIREVENGLNTSPLTIIPRDNVSAAAQGIRSGDIICYVTSVEGLDIAHVAMAYVDKGRVGFIHASMAAGKVVLDQKTISEYVQGRKGLAGIKVVRPIK